MFKNIVQSKLWLPLLLAVFVFSGCGNTVSFQKGDIKDDFCGAYLNFQYCKCAFHNDYCDAVGMSKGDAKNYVNEQYDAWVEAEKEKFLEQCEEDGGIPQGSKCKYCEDDEVAVNGKCESADVAEEEDEESGECKYDSDCDPICEGGVAWKMGCDPRENKCIKTFDTDCAADVETFGEMEFPKACQAGECVRDEASLQAKRQELEDLKQTYSDEVKDINKLRDDLRNVMMDANKNCINGIADMTNVAIVEFATRIASLAAGGLPDLASVSVDYVNDGINRLSAYADGTPSEEKQLKPDEYIKLNCGLYDFFKQKLAATDTELEAALEGARQADDQLQQLP